MLSLIALWCMWGIAACIMLYVGFHLLRVLFAAVGAMFAMLFNPASMIAMTVLAVIILAFVSVLSK